MPINRQFKESPVEQGEDESIAYTLTTTPWGSNPGAIVVGLYSLDANEAKTDVSSTKLTGAAIAVGDVITTPLVGSLTAGTRYRLEVRFTCSGNVFEAYGFIDGVV